jgi:very-short-patch-repair endonuclease
MNYPYNQKLKERATALRKAGNLSEIVLWKRLRGKRFHGITFNRQIVIGNFIVDFLCQERNTVIEIDGSSHDDKREYDTERDAFLIGLGLQVVRVSAEDVLNNITSVIKTLEEKLFQSP